MGIISKQSLTEEIIENARNDRKRLEAVAEGLTHGFGQFQDNSSEDGGGLDPEVSAAFAEEIAKVTDSLSKINQQLVELVKIDAKKEADKPTKDPAKMSKDEKEALYEELQTQEELN